MEVKKCPFCGKTVLAIAKVCKHCGKSLEEQPAVKQEPQPQFAAPPQPAAPVSQPAPMLSSPRPAGNKGKTPFIIAGAVIAVAIIAVAGILIGKLLNSSSNDYQAEAYQPAQVVQPSPETPLVVNQPQEITPPETVYAYINGTKVIMRASHSTTSSKLGFFDDGERLQILDEYTPSNSDEAITNTKVNLYNSYGEKIYVLPKGKAVRILSKNEGRVEVQFYHSQYGNLTATVSSLDLESIAGEKWYRVKRYSGETGWVFSKFVNKLR